MITKEQIKEYILSLGFIDNTKNWRSHGGDGVWLTWPGACNNAFLLSKDYLRIFSWPEDKNGQLHFDGGSSILYDNITDFNLDKIKEFRDKIIRFKKEQRFKKIEEL